MEPKFSGLDLQIDPTLSGAFGTTAVEPDYNVPAPVGSTVDAQGRVVVPKDKSEGVFIAVLIVLALLSGCGTAKGYAKDVLSCVPEAIKAGLQCVAEKRLARNGAEACEVVNP